MVGVEVDTISAEIAQFLYPHATILNEGFEKVRFPDKSFSAAVGNVPFGNFQLYDPGHNPGKHSIHNHFIIKTLDLVKPGGYVAVVTSTFTADSKTGAARRDMIARADLISAVRLPNKSFRDVAGTDVATDILVFRVREHGKQPTTLSESFIPTRDLELDNSDILSVNKVFVDNPARILGTPSMKIGQFGRPTIHVSAGRDIEDLAQKIDTTLTTDVEAAKHQGLGHTPTTDYISASDIASEASSTPSPPGFIRHTIDADGKLVFEQYQGGEEWKTLKPGTGASKQEWQALLDLRDATVALRDAYRDHSNTIPTFQAELHRQYDAYVGDYGPISRFETPLPKPPSKTAQEKIYKELVTQWREDNLLGKNDVPPPAIEAELREAAATPISPVVKKRPHISGLRSDPFISTLFSLENFNEQTQQAEKSRIFFGNPARPAITISHADTLEDAAEISLDRHGVIDAAAVAKLTGTSQSIVEEELVEKRIAFRDPANPDAFLRAPHYLSGDVASKLALAMEKAKTDHRFDSNVHALQEVQPTPITEGIDVRPGVQWINDEYYKQFISETFKISPSAFTLSLTDDRWQITVHRDASGESLWDTGGDIDRTYGVIAANNRYHISFNYQSANVEARQAENQGIAASAPAKGVAVTAIKLFEHVLNLESKTITWSAAWCEAHDMPVGTVNAEATAFTQRRAQALRDEFTTWLMAEPNRWQDVVATYNQHFNSYVAAQWDGSYRRLPGLGDTFTPYSYQLNAVERMNNEPAVLLNHAVGAGKTGTFFMGTAELKRLGKINQPWFIVPNHLAEQAALEANQWYPDKRVLSAAGISNKEDRATFVAQSISADWDFVIVPQSVFFSIPMSPETQVAYIEGQREQLRQELIAHQEVNSESFSVKEIQRMLRQQDEALTALLKAEKDPGISFEATNCDYLVIDEAHDYKNLHRLSTISDISHPGSKRSSDLDMKIDFLRHKAAQAGKNPDTTPIVTFATGTPIANNLAEIWVMAKYLRPDLLRRAGVETINSWAATFTEQHEDVEVKPSGSGLRNVNRTRGFLNVGDLAALCEPFMDVVTPAQIEANVPKLIGDKNTVIEFDVDQQAKDFIADFDSRLNKDWTVQYPNDAVAIDNTLKMMSDGKKVALDPRLVNLEYDGYSPRVANAAEQISSVWRQHKDTTYLSDTGEVSSQRGGLQIVFLDKSTPKKDGSYSVYEQLRSALVDNGMDPQRIAFIHDWDDNRARLFDMCRNGGIDVLIGTTGKLGTGANIQNRAVALHHLDVPYRPADLEQREGRILRQGNQNAEVQIFNYIARGTTDAVDWQILDRKTRFINQFHQADRSIRRMEAIESSAEEAAAQNKAIATGDQRYVELLQLDKQVAELESQQTEWKASVESSRMARIHENHTIDSGKEFLDYISPLRQSAQAWSDATDKTWALPSGEIFTDRAEATKLVSAHIAKVFRERREDVTPLVTIGGVSFSAAFSRARTRVEVMPSGLRRADMTVGFEFNDIEHEQVGDKPTQLQYSIMQRIENRVRAIPKEAEKVQQEVAAAVMRLDKLQTSAPLSFPRGDELAEATAARDALRADLKKMDSSEQAKRLRAERKERLVVHGRAPGWSLRLNPTPKFAELVEKASVEETIAKAKLDEIQALFAHGQITFDELTVRKRAIDGFDDSSELCHDAKAARGLLDNIVGYSKFDARQSMLQQYSENQSEPEAQLPYNEL